MIFSVGIPVSKPYVTPNVYGEILHDGKVNTGIDFVSHSDSYVYSIYDGVVSHKTNSSICISHVAPNGKKFRSLYFHVFDNCVSINQPVMKGEVLGMFFNKPYSVVSRLHLKIVDEKWNPINPMYLLEK